MKKAHKPKLESTIYGWARALGTTEQTLHNKLRRAGFAVAPRRLIPASEILTALTASSEKDEATAREARARAVKIERQNAIEAKEIMSKAEIDKMLREILLPVRQRLDALPGEAAHLCNPTDPDHARTALKEWVKMSLPVIRADAEKESK